MNGKSSVSTTADTLTTPRTISATGDATWGVTFNGGSNVSASLTLATVNANTGTYGGIKTSAQLSLDGKGRVTSAAAITIQPDYSNIDAVPTSRFLGRATAGTGFAEAMTAAQATALLNVFTALLQGLVPASGGGTTNFLRADGTWAATPAPTGAALTKVDDTNVTLTLGGTPASALLQGVSITVGWAGILPASRGGTANGFTAFSGPATSTKTFTLPNASDTIACLGQAQTFTQKQSIVVSGGGIALAFGNHSFALTATPDIIDMGAKVSNAAGANLKIRIYYDGTLEGGFGFSNGQMDYVTPNTGTIHVFYLATTKIADINTTGLNLASGMVIKVNSTQVVGARKTGWAADTGTAKRTANATYSGTAEASYTQATIQALMNAVRDLSQTQKAIKDDLISHGLFGT